MSFGTQLAVQYQLQTNSPNTFFLDTPLSLLQPQQTLSIAVVSSNFLISISFKFIIIPHSAFLGLVTDIYIYGSITDYSKTRSGNSPHSSLEWYITLHCKVSQLRLRLRLLPPPHLGLLCGSPICSLTRSLHYVGLSSRPSLGLLVQRYRLFSNVV